MLDSRYSLREYILMNCKNVDLIIHNAFLYDVFFGVRKNKPISNNMMLIGTR